LVIPCGGLIAPVCGLGNDCPVGTTCQTDLVGQPCVCQ